MAESDLIIQKLLVRLQGLSQTPYACSNWAQVSGGTTNFIYRGTLLQPLEQPDGSVVDSQNTIILKHATANVPGNEDFWLDIARCVSFQFYLGTLANDPPFVRAYHADAVVRSSKRICFMPW